MSLFITAALLFVQAPEAAAPAPVEVEKPASNKKICRVDSLDTGSRMKKRLCLTEVEWANRKAGKNSGDLKRMGAR